MQLHYQDLNKFDEIQGYVSASPTVGNKNYADWFNALQDNNGNLLGNNFYRLTNKSDIVPMVPGSWLGFIPVAQEVLFDAPYTDDDNSAQIAKNHQICCCYAYALRHPNNVFNRSNQDETCKFPVGQPPHYFQIAQHLDNLRLYYGSFVDIDDAVTSQTITTVYPNSLVNMRDRVVDTVGQTNTILPLWMTSKQTNGRVLGFTKAWVIAYTNPGESDRISYNIRTQFGEILNRIDFISDRYILDNQLTANWVPNEDSTDGGNWNPSPPFSTTFNANQSVNPTSSGNETTFDGNSLRFTSPVDVYGKTDKYDKYLVFPKTNILG